MKTPPICSVSVELPNEIRLKPHPIMHTLSKLTCIAATALISVNVGTAQTPEEIDALIAKALPEKPTVVPESPRKVLVFSRCEGPRHECIDVARKAFIMMGEKTGAYTTIVSDEMDAFDPENIARYDAILLNNTTNLKFENPVHREALLSFVADGKGIIGIHAATDNFQAFPEAGEMMGGYFHGHPWNFTGTWAVKVEDKTHPVNAAFGGEDFAIRDEIYQFRGPYSRTTHRVLLSLDMDDERNHGVDGILRDDNDFPISWVKTWGEGRVFYCSLGHNPEVYWNPTILQHYLDGIQYALGDLEADDTPSQP